MILRESFCGKYLQILFIIVWITWGDCFFALVQLMKFCIVIGEIIERTFPFQISLLPAADKETIWYGANILRRNLGLTKRIIPRFELILQLLRNASLHNVLWIKADKVFKIFYVRVCRRNKNTIAVSTFFYCTAGRAPIIYTCTNRCLLRTWKSSSQMHHK